MSASARDDATSARVSACSRICESVEDIISALLEEAAVAIRWAEQYEVSKRQGLRNSVPIYKARAEVALQAVKHLEEAL